MTSEVSQAQIDALGRRMENGLDDIKDLLSSFEERLRKVESSERVYQEHIGALNKSLDKGIDEIKAMLSTFDKRMREVETQDASFQPLLTSRMDAAWRRIDAHSIELDRYREGLVMLTQSIKQLESISRWLVGIFTSVIVAVVIGFVTGKIDIFVR